MTKGWKWTRRGLVSGGFAFSAAALLPAAGRTQAAATVPDSAATLSHSSTRMPRRERLLFDFDWKFAFGHGSDPTKDLGFGFGQSDFSKTGNLAFARVGFDDAQWRPLNLPHDWGVELPFVHDDAGKGDEQTRSHGYKPLGRRYPETSVGWYRREFEIPSSDAGRRIWVEFDGASRDVLVFVNGCFVGRNDTSYTPFRFDLTDFLVFGGNNAITLRVDASYGDGWFYEGAGIYRHAWLLKTEAIYLERWESVVRAELNLGSPTLHLEAIARNMQASDRSTAIQWTVIDPSGHQVATVRTPAIQVRAGQSAPFSTTLTLDQPQFWSTEAPRMYSALVVLQADGVDLDLEQIDFGVRSAVFDADRGFFLNGRSLKIQGMCNHQDHAGVGVALPDRLQTYRLEIMRRMGANAIRSAHNMPTPELVEACDRMGIMVMCETRQMSSSPEGLQQLETMVKRFRNSPSVVLWSIGNEENDLESGMAEQGRKIAGAMVSLCHALDPTRPVTAAVNADNESGVGEAVDVVGFNYHREFPDAFHERHPKRPVLCSEDASDVSTRGEYVTDWQRNVVSCFDGDAPWKKSPENWWKFYAGRDWTAGGFAWTGFDYRGEPSPFGWPSINSNFGVVDTCGFPKDYFYYYQAWWNNTPMLHLFPHWNWAGKENEEIPVWVYSNLDEVELFLNGQSLGRQAVPALGHIEWKARYKPGAIEAWGFKEGRRVLVKRRETTNEPRQIRLSADRSALRADGEDIAVLTVEVLDNRGRPVPTANLPVIFQVGGPGTLAGVGNGNPNCLESDKAPRRSLYNGLAQLIVQTTRTPGDISVEARCEDGVTLRSARIVLSAAQSILRPAVI